MTQLAISNQVFDPANKFTKEKTEELIAAMMLLPPVESKVDHLFSKGVYCRTITIEAGVLIVGRVHKTEHLNIISSGKIHVRMGEELRTITGPHIFVSGAGVQKIVFAEETTVWTTIHVTEETDMEKIEAETVEPIEQNHLIESEDLGVLP